MALLPLKPDKKEQEERYKYLLSMNPKDVDALCGYACMQSALNGNYDEASDLYRYSAYSVLLSRVRASDKR